MKSAGNLRTGPHLECRTGRPKGDFRIDSSEIDGTGSSGTL